MPRIPEIRDENATPEQLSVLEREHASSGGVLNTSRIWAYRPHALSALQGLHGALEENRTLPAGLVSLARLRVSQINGCPF
jgi:alkylhydroperoxidase family enzyme